MNKIFAEEEKSDAIIPLKFILSAVHKNLFCMLQKGQSKSFCCRRMYATAKQVLTYRRAVHCQIYADKMNLTHACFNIYFSSYKKKRKARKNICKEFLK